jgi:hypothetical protein
MPHWASRLTLEILKVRVERLNALTESDAIAEGIVPSDLLDSVGTFKILWNRINAKRGFPWEADPWVWRLEFQKIVG